MGNHRRDEDGLKMSERINSRNESVSTTDYGLARFDARDYEYEGEKNCEYCGAYLPYSEDVPRFALECPLCHKMVFGVPFEEKF